MYNRKQSLTPFLLWIFAGHCAARMETTYNADGRGRRIPVKEFHEMPAPDFLGLEWRGSYPGKAKLCV
jgi:hypothetical protein